MKIAQIAPLFESVPPRSYGGTERVVSYLTEELVRQGHEVTLFASGDSRTAAELVPICPRSLRLDGAGDDAIAAHVLQLERVFQQAGRFDVIHSHVDILPYPLIRRAPDLAVLSTLHGRLDLSALVPLYREFRDIPVAAISDAQRAPLPWLDWRGVVHHGLPADMYRLRPEPGKYLAFVGRVSPEKRLDAAIDIASQAGMPLKIAAKVDRDEREYFRTAIAPRLHDPGVEFIGEITEADKGDLLGGACALLFPIDWPEPFGLVMIEAMACGTPVIARRRGSVPEVITQGVSGFIVEDAGEAIAAVSRAASLSRAAVRRAFEERFTAARMARDYLGVYRDLIREKELSARCGRRPIHAGDQPT